EQHTGHAVRDVLPSSWLYRDKHCTGRFQEAGKRLLRTQLTAPPQPDILQGHDERSGFIRQRDREATICTAEHQCCLTRLTTGELRATIKVPVFRVVDRVLRSKCPERGQG